MTTRQERADAAYAKARSEQNVEALKERLLNQPSRNPMRPRSIRVDDDLWDAAAETAMRRGDNLSRIVREGLRSYVKAHED